MRHTFTSVSWVITPITFPPMCWVPLIAGAGAGIYAERNDMAPAGSGPKIAGLNREAFCESFLKCVVCGWQPNPLLSDRGRLAPGLFTLQGRVGSIAETRVFVWTLRADILVRYLSICYRC
jgi:hypothetical protein